MSKFTAAKIQEIVGGDYVSRYKDIYKVYRGYFYRFGRDETTLRDNISDRLTKAGIAHIMLDCGDHYADFRGGAKIQKSSHFWTTFAITE